ncbi:GntR family transcriptional regulator [Acuticoccus sediminis]|uniref:GntR family transcriptional regulator n=1 Tax=Acuticoccus sediminis TaxID=2184697 RepID=UPI001CFE1613|nr:GntR family transcriptional regulator [Acuticoccus sediminis]
MSGTVGAMPIEAIEKRASLSDIAMERLVDAVSRGELVPGERFQEAALARQLGISRGPLREAIRRLEGRNLLVRVPHVGVMVASPSPEEVLDLFMMREALEGLACRLAAERMTDGELDEIDAVLARHGEQPDVTSGNGYYQFPGDQDFHYRIIRGSRSARLEELLLGELYHFMRIFRYQSSVEPGRAQAAHTEHVDVARALRRRDPDAAEAAMRLHTAHARLSIARAVEQARARHGDGGNRDRGGTDRGNKDQE